MRGDPGPGRWAWRPGAGELRRCGTLAARVVPRHEAAPDRTIVLLHGIASSQAQFDATWDELAAHGDVVIPDLLGFAGSLDRRRRGHCLDDHLDALDELLAAVEPDAGRQLVVAGHSLGGALGLSLAARHAGRTRLVMAWGAPLHLDGETARRHVRGMGRLNALVGLDTAFARAVCTLVCPRHFLSRPLYRLARPQLPLPILHDAVLHTWHSYIGSMRSILFDAPWPAALDRLDAAACPVVLVAGADDRAVDHPLMQRVAARYEAVEFEQLPGDGHDLPISDPSRCLRRIVEGLAATPAPASSPAGASAPPRSPVR